ncbi:MAG TPA: hypothetical protein VFZ24_06155 [Longimicrobiales bacterium]
MILVRHCLDHIVSRADGGWVVPPGRRTASAGLLTLPQPEVIEHALH